MATPLLLESFSLLPKGPTLGLQLESGQSLCVLGPAGSGKTRFLSVILGEERPGQGRVKPGRVAAASAEGFSRRTTPASIIRKAAPRPKSSLAAEALNATELWEKREEPLSELSSSQQAAAELLSCLGADGDLMLIDGQLDRLDPWTLRRVWRMLSSRLRQGVALVAVTNRPEAVAAFDLILVLHKGQAKFLGTWDDLRKKTAPTEVKVSTISETSVEALTDSFEIRAARSGDTLVLQAPQGQELAARFLLEGYGAVEAVGLAEPTLEQRILSLIK